MDQEERKIVDKRYFEREPRGLTVGIKIRNITKVRFKSFSRNKQSFSPIAFISIVFVVHKLFVA